MVERVSCFTRLDNRSQKSSEDDWRLVWVGELIVHRLMAKDLVSPAGEVAQLRYSIWVTGAFVFSTVRVMSLVNDFREIFTAHWFMVKVDGSLLTFQTAVAVFLAAIQSVDKLAICEQQKTVPALHCWLFQGNSKWMRLLEESLSLEHSLRGEDTLACVGC